MARNPSLDLDQLREITRTPDVPWDMSVTSISALTEDEREIRLGVPSPPEEQIEHLEEGVEGAAATARGASGEAIGVPTSFDLRDVNGVNYSTDVRDQGNCGSCVAFGVVATMEGVARFMRQRPTLPVDLSEAHLFYCHGYNAGARCNTGWWPDQAFGAARDKGVTFDDYYPYTPTQQSCTGLNKDWPNRLAKATSFQTITNKPAEMKRLISSNGSITACLDVYQDFFSYSSGVYRHVSGGYAGGHCVSLIGYDDTQGCWVGKNSWGRGWGDSGYFRIAYGQCRIESYQTVGLAGVGLRWWNPDQQILGLWSDDRDANLWAYGSARGWMKLDGANSVTGQAMLSELAAAKAGGRPVRIFENYDIVHEIYT